MKTKQKALLGLITLMMLGAAAAYFGLGAADIVVVGLDSQLSAVQKKALFEQHAHEIPYPDEGEEVCYRLEPGFFEEGEIYGEYLRFKANEDQQLAYIQATLGGESLTEDPLPYSQWHQGVGNYPWWQPMQVENPVFYENGRKFITIDPDQGIVYYSFVRSYSRVLERATPSTPKE